MRTLGWILVASGLIAGTRPASLEAQRPVPAEPQAEPASLRPLRVAKWATLAAAAGAAAWGFVQNDRADDGFADLERQCSAAPSRCTRRLPGGAYEDAEFERLYQEVRAHDRRAWTALLLSQVAVGTSVVLFLLDLGNAKRPPDIPFIPTAVEWTQRGDGALEVSITLPVAGR